MVEGFLDEVPQYGCYLSVCDHVERIGSQIEDEGEVDLPADYWKSDPVGSRCLPTAVDPDYRSYPFELLNIMVSLWIRNKISCTYTSPPVGLSQR